MRKTFAHETYKIMQKNGQVVVLLGDIGVFGFQDSFKTFPERIFNIGILEQTMIGMGAGLSSEGLIPVIHTIAPFITERALEQIKIDFGYQNLRGNLVSVGGSFDYAALGCTHHCPGDVQTMLGVPNTEVYVPGTAKEFAYLFNKAFDNSKLSYFRLSEKVNRYSLEIEIGEPAIIQIGKKATIVCVGPTLDLTLDVFTGLDVTIVYLTSLRPLSIEKLKAINVSNNFLFIEPFYVGTTIQELFRNNHFVSGNYSFIGVPHDFIRKYGTREEIEDYIGFNKTNIYQKYLKLINE